MQKIDIFVRNRMIRLKYTRHNKTKEYKWEDNYNISRNFLLRLDKINNCNKNNINCLFKGNSDSVSEPTTIFLRREGRESTTYRIILVSLRALEWAGFCKVNVSR